MPEAPRPLRAKGAPPCRAHAGYKLPRRFVFLDAMAELVYGEPTEKLIRETLRARGLLEEEPRA